MTWLTRVLLALLGLVFAAELSLVAAGCLLMLTIVFLAPGFILVLFAGMLFVITLGAAAALARWGVA